MNHIKLYIAKFLNHSILIGMVSIISPSIIHIEPLKFKSVNDNDAIATDWTEVGSYIQDAYDSCRK